MKTPHELACAISALINSKPRSPTVEELEGVIGEHWKTGGDAVLVWKKSDPLAELVECVDELRGSEEATHRELAYQVLKVLREAKVVPTPPMVVVTESIRDSICLGGVAYMSGPPWGNWLPPRILDEPSGD